MSPNKTIQKKRIRNTRTYGTIYLVENDLTRFYNASLVMGFLEQYEASTHKKKSKTSH